MDRILKYFPGISDRQKEQFEALYDLYSDWNSKINVISRKDIGNLYLHHVLHSLAIAKYIIFKPVFHKMGFCFFVRHDTSPVGLFNLLIIA